MWFYTYLYQWVFTFMLLKHVLPFHINLKGKSNGNEFPQHLFFCENLYCFFIFEEQLCWVLVGRFFFRFFVSALWIHYSTLSTPAKFLRRKLLIALWGIPLMWYDFFFSCWSLILWFSKVLFQCVLMKSSLGWIYLEFYELYKPGCSYILLDLESFHPFLKTKLSAPFYISSHSGTPMMHIYFLMMILYNSCRFPFTLFSPLSSAGQC